MNQNANKNEYPKIQQKRNHHEMRKTSIQCLNLHKHISKWRILFTLLLRVNCVNFVQFKHGASFFLHVVVLGNKIFFTNYFSGPIFNLMKHIDELFF